MLKLISDVKAFHNAGAGPVVNKPAVMPWERTVLRQGLLEDECNEVTEALYDGNLANILQENLDVIYVAVGTLIEAGLGEAAVEGWKALQKSNMSKVNVETGKLVKREDGKILKPEGFKEVDWQAIVDEFSLYYSVDYVLVGGELEVALTMNDYKPFIKRHKETVERGESTVFLTLEAYATKHRDFLSRECVRLGQSEGEDSSVDTNYSDRSVTGDE